MAQTIDTDRGEVSGDIDATPPQCIHSGPLLIAGERADYTRGALHVAELLALRDRLDAHVLGVVRPPAFPVSLPSDADGEALEEGRRHTHLDRVRQRLDHMSRDDFDLVATGTQEQTQIERHLTDSVSTALLREVSCAVLIAPPLAPAS